MSWTGKRVKTSSEFKGTKGLAESRSEGRQDDQADRKVVQTQAGVKTGKTIKKRIAKGVW